MKKALFVLIIILISVGYIHFKGRSEMKDALSGYVEIGFENSAQYFYLDKKNYEVFNLFINNQEEKPIEVEMEFLINGESVQEIKNEIGTDENINMPPTGKIRQAISEAGAYPAESLDYQVNLTWGKRKESVMKKVELLNHPEEKILKQQILQEKNEQ